MPRSIITLTTDFGNGSPYVAQIKGVILAMDPDATVVDLTHGIPPQDIVQAAQILPALVEFFPPWAIHIVVVDPGVGSERRIVFARLGEKQLIAPDNGCLTGLASRQEPFTIIELAESQYWLPKVSQTFHGRDIMAPVAARLGLGLEPSALGPRLERLIEIELPEARILPGKVEGEVVSIDSFGNLVTNITAEALANAPRDESVTIRCDDHETLGIYNTYADQPEMTLIALVGSSGQLEIAIVNDSAKIMLGVRVGEKVVVKW
jgi:S-adenosylmethionine hydrolase